MTVKTLGAALLTLSLAAGPVLAQTTTSPPATPPASPSHIAGW